MRTAVIGLMLLFGACGPLRAQSAAAPPAPASEEAAPLLPDVSRIDPRLVFLGAGVLVGLVIASPGLELGEVLGIALGVVGSQYLYYATMPPPAPVRLRPGA